ncbi:hypothetical protein JYT31_00380 [Beggiatoa alba]|nr:hypothetical protein [Beggiatoa alba]
MLREIGVKDVGFISARDENQGLNIALFSVDPLKVNAPYIKMNGYAKPQRMRLISVIEAHFLITHLDLVSLSAQQDVKNNEVGTQNKKRGIEVLCKTLLFN